jgi:dolichol-phosphate mannosyltransferase
LKKEKGKSGLGTAYIHGFKWALARNYQYIFEMDADFSHNPADLERLYEACHAGMADVAIGSRYVKGGGTVNWPRNRNIVVERWITLYETDHTDARKRYHRRFYVLQEKKCLKPMNLDELHFLGYAFQIEMKYAAWKLGFKIVEVPIVFEDRKHGSSKMHKGIVKEGILRRAES